MNDENDQNEEQIVDPIQEAEPEENAPSDDDNNDEEEDSEVEAISEYESDTSDEDLDNVPVDRRIVFRNLRERQHFFRLSMDSDNEEESSRDHFFDINLPPLHLYLGLNREDNNESEEAGPLRPVNPRLVYQKNDTKEDACPRHEPPLPIITRRVPVLKNNGHYNMPMMPCQDLPLKLFTDNDIMVVNAALNSEDKSFICVDLQMKGPLYGTVLSVTKFKTDYNSKIVMAHATTRFRLIDVNTELTGLVVADIEILHDSVVKFPLSSVQLQSLRKHEPPTKRQQSLIKGIINYQEEIGYVNLLNERFVTDKLVWKRTKRKIQSVNSAMTSYPAWLYRQCDMYDLAKRLQPHVSTPRNDIETTSLIDPVELCRVACCELPLLSEQRMDLLKMNFVHQRLHYLLNIFEKCQNIVCKNCKKHLANRSDVIVISREGPQNAFVNPGGFVHEMITVRTTVGKLRLQGPSSAVHSWFPGYEWIIVNCPGCIQHLGWKFIAPNDDLVPKKFYGLSRNGVMMM